LGTLFAIGGLELGLRGASVLLRPSPPVSRETGPDDEIRILCIGESTTAGLWPGLLETSLNQQHPEQTFHVINRGNVGIHTGEVLDLLPQWLDKSQPGIAITMLGINDEGNVLVYPRTGRLSPLVEHSRAVKLMALLWRSAWGIGAPPHESSATATPQPDAQWDEAMKEAMDRQFNPRGEAIDAFRFSLLLETQPALLKIDPATPVYHVGLMVDALITTEPQEQMTEFFDRELGLPGSTDMTAAERYEAIRAWGRGQGNAFDTLRMLTSQQRLEGDLAAEKQTLLEATKEHAHTGTALVRYAAFLQFMDRPAGARVILRKARQKLPVDYAWSLALAEISFRFGAYEDARFLINRALESRPNLPIRHEEMLVGWLARATAAAGHEGEARELRARLERLNLEFFKEYTRYNYSRIVDLLRERDIAVITMQYPTLSIEALKKVLDGRDDVLYLENVENFDRALRETSYTTIFCDSFAGSFGHFNEAGEELVAANVTRAVNQLLGFPAAETPAPSIQFP
jgi:tetratricopeptide (TPR) repeat protein